MADRSTPRVVDEVPEADLVEQSIPAYPDDPDADTDIEQEIGVAVDRAALNADAADVIEQSIPVPLDDDFDA